MKLKRLEMILENVYGFRNPKILLEQYQTTPHFAACLLHTAETQFGDLSGKNVADLGCGSGILSIGCGLLDADTCVGIDIDLEALSIFQENAVEFELESCLDCLQANVTVLQALFSKHFDTVVMNPPFGTKFNKGIDMDFLYTASKIAKTAIYSFHKTATRSHVLKKAKDFGLTGQVIAELKFNLSASYKFHKKQSKDIDVDFYRFSIKK